MAAAYAALVSLMNDLELIPAHPTHSFAFDGEQIASLLHTVNFLIHFMEGYGSQGGLGREEAADVVEGRIAAAAHAAHDVIESHIVDQIHSGSTLVGGEATSPRFLHDLQRAIDDMGFVKAKAMQVKAKRRLIGEEEPTYPPEPLPSQKNLMVGLDDVAFQVMDMFVGGSKAQRRGVVSIVGMGGIGKTALASYVYESSLIKQHFDVRLWATISQEYSVEDVLGELLSGQRNSSVSGNAGELGEKLHKKLWGRRYLVVLDDMWSLKAWEKIKMFLPDDGSGSCVMVTTRLSKLASLLNSSRFEMKFLDEDKSWELFCRNAFGEGKDCPVEVDEIGKKIVRRCRGLPLSVVVIGGHLRRSSRAVEYWEKVAGYMNPISSIGPGDQCLSIISLSYHHLPPYLKPCFLYMGIFEEDEQIDASRLVEYWVAEGFLKPKQAMSLEEVAESHLKDLIDRNLIVVGKRRWNGKVEFCGVHDVVRELCLKVAKREKFLCLVDDSTTTKGMQGDEIRRRIVIPRGKKLNSNVIGALNSAAPLLRSLIYQLGQVDYDKLHVEMRLLRVSGYVNNEIRNEDGRDFLDVYTQQVNLRYLAFSSINYLIATTQALWSPSLFWNMQTLIMKYEFFVITAPYQIWEMPQLRSLQFTRGCLPDPDPDPHKRRIVLHNLHTLVGVDDLRLTEEVCERMPNLKVLSLSYDKLPADGCEASSYYCPHNLARFAKLESLKYQFDHDPKWRGVGANMTFPCSLEHLSLWNRNLHWEDLSIAEHLPRLGSLQLNSIRGAEWDLVVEEVEFPSLKVLEIADCYDLIRWNANRSHFPVLEMLCFSGIQELSGIPYNIGEIPTLRLIQVINCSMSAAISAMGVVAEQESLGNEDIRLDIRFVHMEEIVRFKEMAREEDLTVGNLLLYESCRRSALRIIQVIQFIYDYYPSSPLQVDELDVTSFVANSLTDNLPCPHIFDDELSPILLVNVCASPFLDAPPVVDDFDVPIYGRPCPIMQQEEVLGGDTAQILMVRHACFSNHFADNVRNCRFFESRCSRDGHTCMFKQDDVIFEKINIEYKATADVRCRKAHFEFLMPFASDNSFEYEVASDSRTNLFEAEENDGE